MRETAMTIERASTRVTRRLLAFVLVTAIVVAGELIRPGIVEAGWPLAQDARVALGFGATYTAPDGTGATHRGIDVMGHEGERVLAPLAGRVAFAGSVPAAGGGTMRAVTIETAQGSITLMPLTRFDVARGAELAEGDGVGVLAATGDASLAQPHLHVGVRRGDLYVDPLGIMAPPVPQPAEQPEPRPEPLPTEVEAGAQAQAQAGAQARAQTGAGAAVGAPGTVARATGSSAQAMQPTVSNAHLAPGVTLSPAAPAGVGASLSAPRALALAGAPAQASGVSAATARSTEAASAGIAALAAYGQRVVARGARTGAIVALGSLAALATLWPLWRVGTRIGISKVPVSAVVDDVATVPSR